MDLIFGEICNSFIEICRSDLVYLDLHLFSIINSDLKLGHKFEQIWLILQNSGFFQFGDITSNAYDVHINVK